SEPAGGETARATRGAEVDFASRRAALEEKRRRLAARLAEPVVTAAGPDSAPVGAPSPVADGAPGVSAQPPDAAAGDGEIQTRLAPPADPVPPAEPPAGASAPSDEAPPLATAGAVTAPHPSPQTLPHDRADDRSSRAADPVPEPDVAAGHEDGRLSGGPGNRGETGE